MTGGGGGGSGGRPRRRSPKTFRFASRRDAARSGADAPIAASAILARDRAVSHRLLFAIGHVDLSHGLVETRRARTRRCSPPRLLLLIRLSRAADRARRKIAESRARNNRAETYINDRRRFAREMRAAATVILSSRSRDPPIDVYPETFPSPLPSSPPPPPRWNVFLPRGRFNEKNILFYAVLFRRKWN